MSEFDFDLFVIGAGSGGVRAARIASGHGARVAIAEEHRVGGTCVIRGCVPKKMLVYASHFAEDLHDAAQFGWTVGQPQFHWPTLRDSVLAEVTRLEGLYGETLANNNITLFKHLARLTGPHEITLADGQVVTAGHILIATGGWPVRPQFPGAQHGITSNEVFHLPELPRRIVIVGGGYIANEFAGIFNALGSEVTLVNRSDALLRGYDEQIRDRLMQISTAKGINFRLNSQFEHVDRRDDGTLSVKLAGHDAFDADAILFATGRAPRSGGLGLAELGVAMAENGAIIVDDYS
ncbi:MAG: FAD-dependent oxidoreductase, partial [Sphingopyxis sp.]